MSVLFAKLTDTPTDSFKTPTSEEQMEAEYGIKAFVEAYQDAGREVAAKRGIDLTIPTLDKSAKIAEHDVPVPTLNKAMHLAFLRRILEPLPSNYLAFDSTRCWLIYWIAHAHALMGHELDEQTRSRAITTLLHFQNRHTGGFGGGPGQIGHLMGTYASVMALAILGGPGPCPDENDVAMGISVQSGKGGWDAIDRAQLYNFLRSLKQPDGSFTVHKEGETDVRATYCVVCISLIIGIATPELFDGVGEAIAGCQTYEGGLSAASQPFGSSKGDEKYDGAATLGEAHGGYAFCAMAAHLSLSLLPNPQSPEGSAFDSADTSFGKSSWHQSSSASSARLDVEGLARWASSQQGIPVEGAGFRGRTNKLVDGCYGWFTGAGLGTVIAAQLQLHQGRWWHDNETAGGQRDENMSGDDNDGWESEEDSDAPDGLVFDRKGLQEYILAVAQAPRGGLRDKPGKNADAYHTCYNLSGLSLCQHRVQLDEAERRSLLSSWKSASSHTVQDSWQKSCYAAMLGWSLDPKATCILGSSENRMAVTHPIFNINLARARKMMQWAYCQ